MRIHTPILLAFIILSITFGRSNAQCVQSVNFNTWEETGDAAANWNVLSSGSELYTTVNTNYPTMYVGPDTLINVRVTGTFRVEDNLDDDYIGFVFGFQNTWDFNWTGTGAMNHEYYLFDWKKQNQTYVGYTALEGFSLNKVNGSWNRTIASVFPSFWVHTNSTAFDVIATDFSTTNGWVQFTYYDFELLYTPTRAVILIDSDTIFDESGCYEPGLFGFYNYSQSNARYEDFNYELFVDYQIEYENVCFGDTGKFNFIDTSGCAGANAFSNLDTFYWDLGDGTITNDTNPRHVYANPDTFMVSLIATDINGCTDTSQKAIYIHPPPTAAITVPNTCMDDSTFFLDSTYLPMGGEVVAWEWDFGDGSGTDTVENPGYAYSSPGTYTTQLIITTNAGCKDTAEKDVEIFPLPNVNFNIQNACDGQPIQLEDVSTPGLGAIVSNGWDFDTNGTTDAVGVNVTQTYNAWGEYIVELKVTDSLGCSDSLEKTVYQHPLPDAEFFVPGVCFEDASQLIDSTTIDQGDIVGWVWDYGDGDSSIFNQGNVPNPGPTHLYDNPGFKNVTLVVTSDSGCVDSKIKTIPVYYLPVANFEFDTVCDNENTSFINASYNQSGTLTEYLWEFGDGDTAGSANSQHNYVNPGLYGVTFEVTSNHGCKDTIQRSVRVFPTPNTAFGWANNVCEGDTLPFFDQSTIPQVTPGGDQVVFWRWTFNDKDTQEVKNPKYATKKFEDIQVRLKAWSDRGCSSVAYNTAYVFPTPDANFDAFPDCVDYESSFKNTSKVELGIMEGFNWDFGNGQTSTDEHPTVIYKGSGERTVTLEVTSNANCKDVVTKKILIPETPVTDFDLSPELGCSPLKVQMYNETTIGEGGLRYEWYVNDSFYTAESDPFFIIENDTLAPTFHSIRLVAMSDEGCVHVATKFDTIAVLPSPVSAFLLDKNGYDMHDPVVGFENLSRNGVRWLWDFGDGNVSDAFSPTHVYNASGSYPVSLITWNEYECTDTAYRPGRLGPDGKPIGGNGIGVQGRWLLDIDAVTTLYIPSAFTPNGDGVNDVWFVRGFNEGKQFEIEIYNRWGELMFEGYDMNFTWDGKMPNSSKFAPNGAYIYKINYVTSDDEEQELSGSFQIMR